MAAERLGGAEEDRRVETPAVPSDQPDAEPAGSGVDLARAMLAQAKADARAKGVGTGSARTSRRRRRTTDATRSGAHPDERDPQPLGRTSRRLAAEHGWEEDLAVGGVVARWAEVVGADVAAHCQPAGWVDGVLTVSADSTAWATQVRLLAPQLLRRLAEEVGPGTVTRVDVRGPGSPSWTKGRRSVKGRGPRDTYG
jgi:predicted nucleic acid-binding Zn ribbon protein